MRTINCGVIIECESDVYNEIIKKLIAMGHVIDSGKYCVATYFPPCMEDGETYTLQLQLRESTSLKTISAIGKIFSIKYSDIYKMYKAETPIIFRVTLKSALIYSDNLDKIDVPYQILPSFPYSEIKDCHVKGII